MKFANPFALKSNINDKRSSYYDEHIIQKMPQFDTFDEFAERMLPITRFNAKHRTLLKAVFSFLDHGVYCMTTEMLFYAITGSNEQKATDTAESNLRSYV